MSQRPGLAQVMHAAERIGRFFEVTSAAFCVFFFATMTAVTLLGVFFRYVMQNPFQWTEEIARFLLVWMSFLAINIALRKGQHICIPVVVERMPSPVAKAIEYAVLALIGYFLIVLLKQGYLMTTKTMVTASTFHLSMFWVYMSVPMGALLTLIQLVLNTTKKILSEFAPVSNDA